MYNFQIILFAVRNSIQEQMILIVKDFITAKKIRKINKKGEEMTNNLRRFSQDLRAFAKRTKDFKYTESALITFLITGMIFSAGKLDAAPKEPTIESQRRSISTSITDMRQNFKRVKAETKKLIKDSNM